MFRVLFKIILFVPYRLTCWTRLINRKELRKFRGKPVVVVCNHKSNFDIPAMFMGLPREIYFISKPSLFEKPFRRWFFTNLNGFPIHKGKEIAVIKHSLGVLKRNKLLLIFPEGMRVFNPEDALAMRNGASLIAIKANVPILPMVLNRAPGFFRLCKIKVGEPISVEEFQDRKVDKDELSAFSGRVADVMSGMLEGFEKKQKKKAWDAVPVGGARAITIKKNDDGEDEILLLKRSKPAYKDGATYYTFPGGYVDEGEDLRTAATREVMEETGITVQPRTILYKKIKEVNGADILGKMEAFYLCEYMTGNVTKNPESEEHCEGAELMLDRYGVIRGTTDPVWVPIKEIYDESFDLKPKVIKKQLLKDYTQKGSRIIKKTKYFETKIKKN
ncbi:MAG: 1-acyl-sn-glycerol-3-phosphate acyltransferase [Firmicutes bacterium]|nr:1-acyl-sn-glycerol-3-phosphate acyltransferase [Bacillota bacterium]